MWIYGLYCGVLISDILHIFSSAIPKPPVLEISTAGPMSPELGKLAALTYLNLQYNKLSGASPTRTLLVITGRQEPLPAFLDLDTWMDADAAAGFLHAYRKSNQLYIQDILMRLPEARCCEARAPAACVESSRPARSVLRKHVIGEREDVGTPLIRLVLE